MKHRRHPYNDVVENKLEQLPPMDAEHLWTGMHAILDKKMPQEKERRRFIAWLFTTRGLLLLALISLTVSGSLFLSSNKLNSKTAIINSTQNNQTNNKETAAPASHENDNRTVAFEMKDTPQQNTQTNSSESAQQKMENKYSLSHEATQYSETYSVINPGNQIIQPNYTLAPGEKINDIGIGTSNNFLPNDNSSTNNSARETSIVNADSQIKDSLNDTQQQPLATPAKTNKGPKEKGVYAGIVSGLDLSSIHFQSMKTGATKGLLLGYAFNKKWSLESGLFWDNKRFYDNGTHFNPPGYTPTAGVTITSVNGKNRLYEVPVNVKYAFISSKHSLFATAGVSSYFMRSENYDYEYTQNSQPGGHNYISYKNESRNWFSVANFSLGYSQKLGSVGTIRVEPYLKLPIGKLGVSNMPIMSTGLNIGFTKQLTR